MPATPPHLVFVYGTLKQGFANHHLLTDSALQGRVRTLQAFPLVIAGPWYAPSMLDDPGAGAQVVGELYLVDAQTLAALDQLERVGQAGGYIRRRLWVADLEQLANSSEAYAYVKPLPFLEQIHQTDLAVYEDRRYIAPHQRA